MFGPDILVRTLSKATRRDSHGNAWQYNSRSDHHSKVACWGILFDLLLDCPLLRRHVGSGAVRFGINHQMSDFRQRRNKKLDLVLCRPDTKRTRGTKKTFETMRTEYEIDLTDTEERALKVLPPLEESAVASVLMALEAKACMTAHQRALPRLYDELNSSHQTVHGATAEAISAGFVMVNAAEVFLSSDRNKENRRDNPRWNRHKQPRDTSITIDKVHQIPRRSRVEDVGYDALSIVVVSCRNDLSPVQLVDAPPAPRPGDIYHYDSMIARLSQIYATRFKDL